MVIPDDKQLTPPEEKPQEEAETPTPLTSAREERDPEQEDTVDFVEWYLHKRNILARFKNL